MSVRKSIGKMTRLLLVACVLALSGVAWASPHADQFPQDGTRYSNNIYEDARLDVPDLARKYGYPLEEHEVTTSDGYILTMHRIPHGRNNQDTTGSRPVIFIQHGLLSSSADFINMGPGKGLGYIMADEGFDVWMGNARGTYYSRRHLTRNPDAILNTDFWEFSWHEIGHFDLAAMIDYTLAYTGRSALHYAGHSQGTTAFWVLAASRPEYNAKIISMHALAPICYMSNVESTFLRFISPFANSIESMTSLFGMGEFLPNNDIMTWAGQRLCEDEATTQSLCTNIVFLIGGYNEEQLNATMFPVKMGHTPAGASVRQFAHYGQGISSARFRQYDHGSIRNRIVYGSWSPPDYDLKKITAPVFLHYSDGDPLADIRDVDQLFRELGRPVGKFRVQQSSFSHVDFMWAIDAKTLVYDRMINLIKAMEP